MEHDEFDGQFTRSVSIGSADIVWSLDSAAPRLAQALEAASPWVRKTYDSLKTGMFVGTTCRTFNAGAFFRPAGHYRAFYMRGADDGVLGIKGTEVFATDVHEMLVGIKHIRHTRNDKKHSHIEHLPIIEQKVPMALLVDEALPEAIKAQAFQTAHLERYGELAAVPVPLIVVKWPDPVVATFREMLMPMLSERAAALVDQRLVSGLSAYVYHYRSLPLRALHIDAAIDSKQPSHDGYRHRLAALEGRTDARQVLTDWVALVARMFALGYMPCTHALHETGQCLRSNNAVVDGGFVDLDSLQLMSTIKSDEEFAETLFVTLHELTDTVMTFALGSGLAKSNVGPSSLAISHHVYALVRDELRSAIDEEAARGVEFDPRLMSLLRHDGLFSGLDHVLGALFPPAPSRT
ncbi:MAG: hypothetical protein WKG01_13710 [Kofleriaceae bacterium]